MRVTPEALNALIMLRIALTQKLQAKKIKLHKQLGNSTELCMWYTCLHVFWKIVGSDVRLLVDNA